MKYFAYGSNMDPERIKRRKVFFSKRDHAVIKNYSLKFNKVAYSNPKMGYANIVPFQNEVVEGVLYEIYYQDLKKLDIPEGYPEHYNRIMLRVLLDDLSQIEAVVYVAQPNRTKDGLRPSKEYLSHLLKGKDILSSAYYLKLKLVPTLDEE